MYVVRNTLKETLLVWKRARATNRVLGSGQSEGHLCQHPRDRGGSLPHSRADRFVHFGNGSVSVQATFVFKEFVFLRLVGSLKTCKCFFESFQFFVLPFCQ